ncbi:MAG: methionyl-tRNA formyltransferase [Candidatus Puniceispirillum sp.]|nr:methionyl-tRNA formyltransferase [Candidatus Pelagibacter sp.]MBA4282717.1 methionyl-tRNA formyltransferase [Candidatus Puniceispirillum sp.]
MKKSRIIFMGTPDFAVPTLQSLFNHSEVEVVAVFTQPPKPKNRGQHLQKTPVHLLAEENNIQVLTPSTLKDESIQNTIKDLDADLIVVVAYGMLLPKEVLSIPRRGCLNIHASLLPRWRGAAPIQRCIQAGDKETGVCLMDMDVGLDTGDVYALSTIPILITDTAQSIHDKLSSAGSELLYEKLSNILSGTLELTHQLEEGITYAHKLKKEEGQINWEMPAVDIVNQIRAFHLWPGSFFTLPNQEVIKVHLAQIANDVATQDLQIGDFFQSKPDTWCVKCGNQTTLELLQIQKMGGKILAVKDFLKGTRIF